MLSLLAGLAMAGSLDGWQDSRWLVEIEETLPLQLAMSTPEANPPFARAVQISAITSCPDFKMAGKKAAYVGCKIDKIGLRMSPAGNPGPRLAEYQAALKVIEEAALGGSFELKVKDDGRLASVDFQEPAKTDPIAVEALRALAVDLFAGFSIAREDVPAGSAWEEKGSLLLRGPTRPMGQGVCKIRHTPMQHEGKALLQSSAGLPPGPDQPAPGCTYSTNYLSWGAGQVEKMGATSVATTEGGTMGGGAALPQERILDAQLDSITFEGGPGPFLERIWNVRSVPKPDMTGVVGTPLWAAGHIKRLEKDDAPDLGESGLISAPGAPFGDLPAWKPMPTLGG